MCLALPAEIVEIDPTLDKATVSLEGVKKEISLALVEDVSVGDFVLVHVGYALSKVSRSEAEKTLELMAQVGQKTPQIEEVS
ncbi:MAG: HypC/HybG/HupF family hydrogenase formation chaperone [Hyphomicrobiaceae bacterium]|nr:HypC/HybG/HupF family hydrogenase formation chaperone [Hyphomicrobiaceae bacterium]